MKIYILTPVYATATKGTGATPVVHYFAKEWVKLGHEVHVLYLRARYPKIFYWVSKRMSKMLTSLLNQPVHEEPSDDITYEVDGVKVTQISMRKLIPHSKYSHEVLESTLGSIKEYYKKNGLPDIFVGHWHNPQLELLNSLKSEYNIPTCIVFHNNDFEFAKLYKGDFADLVSGVDIIGFRSRIGMKTFSELYGAPKRSFIASSGVSSVFLKEGLSHNPDFSNGIHDFIYVGILMSRKYPVEVLSALKNTCDSDFNLTFVGNGDKKALIEDSIKQYDLFNSVHLTGRIPREEVIKYLKNSQVFVMISKGEIFGLVYLEAMALGLITIGSKDEGIDGIIQNGVNGFLCEAGNQEELEKIIIHIKSMSPEDLNKISENAKKTALEYSDSEVANRYLKNLSQLTN